MEATKLELADIYDGATKLLEILPKERFEGDEWLILAISKRAVILAELISKKLNIPYDMLFLENIYSGINQDYPVGMVSESEEILYIEPLVKAFEIQHEYIFGEAHRRYEEKILPNIYKFRKGATLSSLEGKKILLLDCSCETGLRAQTAIKTCLAKKADLVVFAVPFLPMEVEQELESVADEIYTLYRIVNFVSANFYYNNYEVMEEEKLLKILVESNYYLPFLKQEKSKPGENS